MQPTDDSLDMLLEEALEFADRRERDLWLVQRCGDDFEKLKELRSLIAASEKTVFLDTPLEVVREGQQVLQSLDGVQIGPFELIRQIGKGGMGAVYLAQQSQPMTRLVAIKLIQRNLETRYILERFRIEQQTLADMDHPSIARIIDAGATESGFHYIAMEYVQGEQILEYCQKNHPSIRVKVNLMLQCCRAIQHAHQKGTIHRDIKPSNVMVTIVDGEPVVKVIDFGIAKALSRDVEDSNAGEVNIMSVANNSATKTGMLNGTPLFMSPEQYTSRNQSVDTRSDIYSLGALFYTLLTGKPPFDAASAKGKSIGEIREMVLKTPPIPPSQRDPQKASHFRGDLDAIVLKAMKCNPEDRYQSVDQMYEDLQCYLTDYPISAMRASTWTSLKKFSRRHKRFIAATVLGMAGLLTGLVMAVTKERRAVQSEKAARHQAFVSEMLLSSLAVNQNNYSLAKSILARSGDPSALQSKAMADDPRRRLDWRLLTAKIPVEPVTLASFPTRIYFALPLSERNEIACGCKDSHLRVLNGSNGKVRLDIDTQQGEINGLALSPDQQLVASGGDDGTVKLWNIETGELEGSFQASSKSVFQLGWSTDGGVLVTAGIEPDAVLWSIPGYKMVGRLDSASEALECLNVSHRGDVVYGSSKGIVRIGSLNQVPNAEIQDISLSTSRAFAVNRCSTVVISPSSRLLAVGLDNGYLVLLQKMGKNYHAIERIRFKTTVTAIAFDRDENRVAIGEDSGSMHVLNLLRKWPTQSRLSFTKYFIDNNATALGDSINQPSDLWNLVTRSEPLDAKNTLPLDCDRIYLEFSKPLVDPLFPDNYLLEWKDESGQVNPSWAEIPTEVNVKGDGIELKFENRFGGWQTVDHLHALGRVQSWANHSKRISNIFWSKDESSIHSTSEDGKINSLNVDFIGKSIIARTNTIGLIPWVDDRLIMISSDQSISMINWNEATTEPAIHAEFTEQFSRFAGVVADHDKGILICGQEELASTLGPWSVFQWDVSGKKQKKVSQFPPNIQPQSIIGAIDADRFILFYRDLLESQLMPIENFPIGCWDSKLQKMIWSISAIKEPIRFQNISPQRRFLSYAKEREVILVNPRTGEQSSLRQFSDTPITSISFSTDDQFLAVGLSDRSVVCFSTDNGQEVWTLTLPGSAACDLFWSKDRRTFAALSRDGYFRIFDMDLRQMTAEIRLPLPDPVNIKSSPNEDTLYILGLNGTILRVPCPFVP